MRPIGRLYITRRGKPPEVDVFDLDTLKLVGTIPNVGAAGALADPKSGHGFASSNPVTMFDAKTLKVMKTIPVDSHADDLLVDDYNDRLYLWSHTPPYGTVVDAVTGNVLGTVDEGGESENRSATALATCMPSPLTRPTSRLSTPIR